jgi:hypothetical protein
MLICYYSLLIKTFEFFNLRKMLIIDKIKERISLILKIIVVIVYNNSFK